MASYTKYTATSQSVTLSLNNASTVPCLYRPRWQTGNDFDLFLLPPFLVEIRLCFACVTVVVVVVIISTRVTLQDYYDDIRQNQLRELALLNRDSRKASELVAGLGGSQRESPTLGVSSASPSGLQATTSPVIAAPPAATTAAAFPSVTAFSAIGYVINTTAMLWRVLHEDK